MTRPRIVVVGSSNTDMVIESDHVPSRGETVLGRSFLMAPGGKGANQAVAAARLGAEVTLVARVGDDLFGRQAIRGFAAEGIRTALIVRDAAEPSGVAMIMVDAAGENLIAVAPGANHRLTPADVQAASRRIEAADLLLLQLEIPPGTVLAAARAARAAGVDVVLDPAPARPLEPALLELVSILTPNESEAELLTGLPVSDRWSARRAADRLAERGPQVVLITLGSRGCLLRTPESHRLVPAPEVEAVDSTAAGDAFNGALAVALGEGSDLEQAVRFATRAAALSTTRRGAQPSLPRRGELARG